MLVNKILVHTDLRLHEYLYITCSFLQNFQCICTNLIKISCFDTLPHLKHLRTSHLGSCQSDLSIMKILAIHLFSMDCLE